MAPESSRGLDEIDRTLLRILAQDPRIPYSEIADILHEEGFEMTGEGIRYRISKLYKSTSLLLLTTPKEHGWENLRLLISTTTGPKSTDEAYQRLNEMDFWIVCRGIGSFDFYANATVPSNNVAKTLLDQVRELECVDDVQFYLETERETNYDDYLRL